ncbi:hypothetical protein PG994_004803 [Apiospora phragmitis]|uniref:Uncharacterized protein n=1 Tax=Apiospora phragmitis TaxID=2905665 RepID=A0ABR1VRM3_9PEZI
MMSIRHPGTIFLRSVRRNDKLQAGWEKVEGIELLSRVRNARSIDCTVPSNIPINAGVPNGVVRLPTYVKPVGALHRKSKGQ